MPLIKGSDKATMKQNFEEFGEGPTYQHTLNKFSKKVADKQRVAVVLKAAGKAKDMVKSKLKGK